ncbi:hypothetical protein HAX54_007906 [Datura stramonium]|uniref:Uncharacterized protein n=1 Tax=Datura stramonium TaxID=4076 RepID=A0ABS8WX00_DATST|nr:hypothetical protein [Datura stramonium]
MSLVAYGDVIGRTSDEILSFEVLAVSGAIAPTSVVRAGGGIQKKISASTKPLLRSLKEMGESRFREDFSALIGALAMLWVAIVIRFGEVGWHK